MVTRVVMPKLSLTMKEGTVGRWYKKEGETIEKGEPIVELISEKATYDLEAPAAGVLRKIIVDAGANASVDGTLAVITEQDEEYSEEEAPSEPVQHTPGEERIPVSPAAKRLAREHSVDLSLVKGSGAEGRITEDDVQSFLSERSGFLPETKDTIPLTGFRKTSAERVSLSFRTAPHSTIVMEIDASKLAILRKKLKVSYNAILAKAVADALTEHPMINSTLSGDQIKIFRDANIGVAVATENGLVVPVVHSADKKSLTEIDKLLSQLTEKAKQGKLSREEISGGTFTITNLGMYGVDFFSPIINPPEAAILGVGRITEKPVAVGGKIETRPTLMLSLSYDHRIVDGAPAAEFLGKVRDKIEETPSE